MFGMADPEILPDHPHHTQRRVTMMTMKDRIESAIHTAISESRHAVQELDAAAMRRDVHAIGYWSEMSKYWISRIEYYTQQLKEVNG